MCLRNWIAYAVAVWNGFFCFWDVFRGRKATCPDYLSFSGLQETCRVTNSCDVNIGRDSSIPTVSRLQFMSSPVPTGGGHYLAGELAKPNQERDMTSLLKLQSSASAKLMDPSCGFEICMEKSSCSMEVFGCSANGFHDVPLTSNSSRSGQLPGGMQHVNDFQDNAGS